MTWLSNVVIAPKTVGKWRMCTDFTDLNKVCPKDPMMDAYQSYHQIFMAKEDREKTAFITEKAVYCYNVMPFGLKNARTTYQRRPLGALGEGLYYHASYGMKLNRSKCTFGVRGGKFLAYMVSERGIEANPEKIHASMQFGSPKSVKDIKTLTGKIATLNRFIARSADCNLPFFKVLRKVKDFEWIEECEKALQELKAYLTTPPLLAIPLVGEKLYIYLAVLDEAVSSVLVREEHGKQSLVYYVSKIL
ncbi:UNVERIFIED_CONTAM: hypothetical protein Sindi_0048900 [Sesamum indicum]